MEKTLFTWEGWDQQDLMAFTFYNVKLLIPIGPFPVGWKCNSADINYDTGTLQLRNGDSYWEFKLNLSVGEQINA